MATFSMAGAEVGWKDLVDRAYQGEEVIVSEPGTPSVKLVPVNESEPTARVRTRPASGTLSDWDVDALLKALEKPWDDEEQRAFEMID